MIWDRFRKPGGCPDLNLLGSEPGHQLARYNFMVRRDQLHGVFVKRVPNLRQKIFFFAELVENDLRLEGRSSLSFVAEKGSTCRVLKVSERHDLDRPSERFSYPDIVIPGGEMLFT